MVKKQSVKIKLKESIQEKGLADVKFITMLTSFSKDDVNEFTKFLESPYCNRKGTYLVKAFNEIKKFHPHYNSPQFTREYIFGILYPGKQYNDVLMRKILSELQKLAEDFFGWHNRPEFDFPTEMRKLANFRKRSLNKLFDKNYSEVSNYLSDPAGKVNNSYFRNRYELEIEAVIYELFNNKPENTFENLKKIQQHVTYDFLINILDIQYNMLIGSDTSYKQEYSFVNELIKHLDFTELKKFLKENSSEQYPIFEIFYYRWLSYLESNNDEHYYKLKELVLKYLHYFDREDKNYMLIALQNNAIQKVREGRFEFHNEVFSVHKIMIEKDLVIATDEEFMQVSSFRNIFITARVVGEHKWSEWFLENYINKLAPEIRDNIYHHSKALIEFDNKNYESALDELQKTTFDHFMHKLDVQILMLKIYYLTEAFEPALSLIDNLKHYYKDTKKVSSAYRKNNEPFLRFTKRIILARTGNKKVDKEGLIYEIEKTTTLDKRWLLEIAGQL